MSLALAACIPVTGGGGVPEDPNQTPTPVFMKIVAETYIPLVLKSIPGKDDTGSGPVYRSGEIEMITPDMLGAGGEDCHNHFRFTVDNKADPVTVQGDGEQYCHFQSAGMVGTMHAVMEHDVVVGGELKTGDAGETRLVVELVFSGSLKEYTTDLPAGVFNPFPEDKPFEWDDTGPIILNFEYRDGAKVMDTRSNPQGTGSTGSIQTTHTYILHLKK